MTGAQILIQIDYSNLSGSLQDNIGIDNIRFGQSPKGVVPVPPAWLMFGFGLAALARCRGHAPDSGVAG